MVDSVPDLDLLPSESALQAGVQEDMFMDRQDQARFLISVQKQAAHCWPQNRAARVEALRLSIAAGAYRVDSAELAQCVLRNFTRFLEAR
ncbi:MAG TPA: flagellar biosynthesis anti-sigma factor FlgM [Ktedonobacteraceae bacterium]|nr:flagellar biosynthesis anti-sigma factor FlgM [Ktedonobacteraceae bacterium]